MASGNQWKEEVSNTALLPLCLFSKHKATQNMNFKPFSAKI
jgi:hypothetical protein